MTAPPATEPSSLQSVGARVEARLAALLADERRRWAEVDADLAAPIDTLSGLVLGGGKRLRPAFCHWGFVAAGGDPLDPRATDAGAAFELLQAFALVHDDVMDGSASRRGNRTAHLAYSDMHAEAGWLGEDRRFGEGMAILIGNMAHVWADQLMAQAAAGAVLPVWEELRLELNMGQYLDMMGTARRDTGIDRAHLVARYKSGKYTVERPLHVGAALAGRLGELAASLSAYGDPLGEAFQLRDDLLDVFGDSALTGKPIGGDLREGKPTALLATTVTRCPPDQRFLLDGIGNPDLSFEQVDALRDLMDSCGARAAIERSIAALAERAIAAIAVAPVGSEAVTALTELATFVANRQR